MLLFLTLTFSKQNQVLFWKLIPWLFLSHHDNITFLSATDLLPEPQFLSTPLVTQQKYNTSNFLRNWMLNAWPPYVIMTNSSLGQAYWFFRRRFILKNFYLKVIWLLQIIPVFALIQDSGKHQKHVDLFYVQQQWLALY